MKKTSRPFFMVGAYGGTALGVLSILCLGMSMMVPTDEGLAAAILLARVGMGVSILSLILAFVKAPGVPRSSMGGLPLLLTTPFLTSVPTLYIGCLGYGLGGDTATSDRLGHYLGASLLMVLVMPIAGLLAARRAVS